MRVLSPAKINLDLNVGPLLENGFHPIRSWMVTVDLCDTLTFAPADRLSLTCNEPSIPADGRNLVWRAAELIGGGRGVAIHLEKQIPAGGGLGGGSSNAAATLVALNEFWQLGHTRQQLHAMAATLGSDVPFFLHGPSSVCTGRGEIVTPVPAPLPQFAVLLVPPIAMPTPAVFRKLDEMRATGQCPAGQPAEKSDQSGLDAVALMATLANDLEAPAFAISPSLGESRQVAEAALGRPVRMSGSGSTLFTLFDDEAEAVTAAKSVGPVLGLKTVAVRITALVSSPSTP